MGVFESAKKRSGFWVAAQKRPAGIGVIVIDAEKPMLTENDNV